MVRKHYTELVVGIVKDAPQVLPLLGYRDRDGATYTRESGEPKGYYLFSLQHRVRSIRRVVTVSLNEAAHWRETPTKPWRKNGLSLFRKI